MSDATSSGEMTQPGPVVVVTGGGRGIGRAIALAFAAEGARIVVNDLGCQANGEGQSGEPAASVADAIVKAGGSAVAHQGDVSDENTTSELGELAQSAFGRIDVWVNNAGILGDRSLLRMSPAQFRRVVAVHLDGTFFGMRTAATAMIKQGDGGRIVNVTSHAGLRGNVAQANTAAAKAAIYGLTRTGAIEWQKHRITVNAIAPVAKTRLTEELPMFSGVDSLSADHVAPAAVFLGTDRCGDRTGLVLGASGSRMHAYRVVESEGRFKEGGAIWTPDEIAEHWTAITK